MCTMIVMFVTMVSFIESRSKMTKSKICQTHVAQIPGFPMKLVGWVLPPVSAPAAW